MEKPCLLKRGTYLSRMERSQISYAVTGCVCVLDSLTVGPRHVTHFTQRTFHYDSSYWTNREEYDPSKGETGFDEQETKLATYWNTRFTKICLGMKLPGEGEIRFIQVPMVTSASSLYEVIADGQYHPTHLGRNRWKTLIGHQASLQHNCNREGFNVESGIHGSSRIRIGYIANQEHDCLSSDSRVGIGGGGFPDDSNTCGNEASYSPDNGDKHMKTMGYILVQ